MCVTWIPCFLIARLFKSISTHFLCLFARSSQVRVNTNDRQQSNVKAFYNTSHLELTVNHPRATNYPERLIKIHFTDIICDWTVGGPRKSSELARRLKSYWPLHLDLTLAGRSGVSKEQPRQSSLQSAEPTSVLFFGGQFRGANRHFYYFYYTQCLKFEAIKPGLIGKIARPSESSNRKEFGGEAEQSWSCPAVASLGLITLASKAGNKPSRSFTVPGEGPFCALRPSPC